MLPVKLFVMANKAFIYNNKVDQSFLRALLHLKWSANIESSKDLEPMAQAPYQQGLKVLFFLWPQDVLMSGKTSQKVMKPAANSWQIF